MLRPTAKWNSQRDVWERLESPTSEQPDVYSETWPVLGTIHNGVLYVPEAKKRKASASRTPELPTSESGSLSLLPTVTSSEHTGAGGIRKEGSPSLRTLVVTRAEEGHSLFPTPRASDGPNGGPNQRGSKGDWALPAIANLLPVPVLFQTPVAAEGVKAPAQQTMREKVKTGQVWLSNDAQTIAQGDF